MKKVVSFILVLVLALAFSVSLVACNKTVKLTQDQLDSYAEWIKQGYLKGKYVVAADFDMPVKGEYEGAEVSIAWTVDGGNGLASVVAKDDQWATIKINKYADEDTTFTLTGTLSYKGMTASVSKELTIEKYVIADWAFWAENNNKVTMNIKGVIVAKYPYNEEKGNTGVFLQDLDGVHGYFAFRLKVASQEAYNNDLAIGNVIEVNGTTSLYNGFREMGEGCTYSLVKNEDGSVATATPAKIAIDDIVLTAASLDGALDPMQGVIATLTGWKVKKLEWNTNTAATFEEKGAGSVYVYLPKNDKEFKLYLSTSNQNTLADLKEAVGKLAQGYTVNVEGPIAWYNAPQIYPLASGITVTSTEVTAADKLATELAAIGFDANVKEAKSFDLAAKGATYEDVAFTWSVSESNVAVIADGKLNVTPIEGEVHSITVSLAATCGSETASKSFDIVVGDPAALTPAQIVAMAYALEKGKSMGFEVTLTGVISEIVTEYSAEHGNITVNLIIDGDEDHIIQAFRLKGEGDNNVATLGVGDSVTVKGMIKNYKGTVEFDAGCLAIAIERFERTDAQKIEEELAILDLPASVKESTSIDLPAKGSLYEEVELSWELLTETEQAAIENGKLNLTVEAAVTTIQVKVTATIGEGETAASGSKTFKIVLGDGSTLTPEQIVDMAFALGADKKLGFDVELTGIVTEIVEAYDPAGYGNITAWFVVEGRFENRIEIYRVKPVEGLDLSDVKVGDKLTVKGDIVNFRGNTVEFSQNDAKVIAYEEGTLPAYFDAKAEANAVELPSTIDEAFEQELPTSGSTDTEVSFQWILTADPDAPVSIEEGILNVQPADEDYTFELALHATKANDEFVRTFNITVSATQMSAEEKIVADIFEKIGGAENNKQWYGGETPIEVTLHGTVTSFYRTWNGTNVSFYVAVAGDQEMEAFGAVPADGINGSLIAIGDEVVVRGYVTNYTKNDVVTIEWSSKNNVSPTVESLTKTDLGRANYELSQLAFGPYDEAATVELAVNGSKFVEVALSYAVDSEDYAIILDEEHVMMVEPGEVDGSVTLTVTATIGEVKATREITFKVTHPLTEEEIVADIFEEIGTAASGTWYGGSNPTLVQLTGTVSKIQTSFNESNSTITLFVDVAGDHNMEAYKAVVDEALDGKLIGVGDEIIVSGYVKNYTKSGVVTIEWDTNNGVAPQIIGHEVSEARKLAEDKEALALENKSFTANATVELPTTGANGSAIVWSMDNTTVFELEGNTLTVTVADDTDATVTLTATLQIGELEDTKEFTLTAKGASAEQGGGSEEPEEPVTVSLAFADKGYANAEVLSGKGAIEVDAKVSLSFDCVSGNTPKYYTSGESVRCYPVNTLTINAEDGYVITAITFTYTQSNATFTSDVGTFDGTNWTGSANEIVFTVSGSGQTRISNISITYEKAA